jgi:restriction system protein
VSFLIAAGLFMAVRQFLPDYAAAFSTLPFLVIAGYSGWLQFRAPSAERVAATLEGLRAMAWPEFSATMEKVFHADGFSVAAASGDAADYVLRKDGKVALVACKRWKVAQAGVAPLRELVGSMESVGAHECIYVAAGELSPNARDYAAKQKIRLLYGAALAQQIAALKKS